MCACTTPAFAYELAVIIRDGMRRMYTDGEDIFYYLTLYNENYPMPAMPEGVEDGILRGLYLYRPAPEPRAHHARILAAGTAMRSALEAQRMLAEEHDVAADVWSVTSYKELYVDGNECERWNRLHPGEKSRVPYLTEQLKNAPGVLVAASDYLKSLPAMVGQWMPRRLCTLGTDGFGRSEGRTALRDFFEVDARFITLATLHELLQEGQMERSAVDKAIADLGINPEKLNPVVS